MSLTSPRGADQHDATPHCRGRALIAQPAKLGVRRIRQLASNTSDGTNHFEVAADAIANTTLARSSAPQARAVQKVPTLRGPP